jgi:hypothetical protein
MPVLAAIAAIVSILGAITTKLWQDAENQWQNNVTTAIQDIIDALNQLFTSLACMQAILLEHIEALPITIAKDQSQGVIRLATDEWNTWHADRAQAQKICDSLIRTMGQLVSAASDAGADMQYMIVTTMAYLLALTKLVARVAQLDPKDQTATFSDYKAYFTVVLGDGPGSLAAQRIKLVAFQRTLHGYLTTMPGIGQTNLRTAVAPDGSSYGTVSETISLVNGRYQVFDEFTMLYRSPFPPIPAPKPWPTHTITTPATPVDHDDFISYNAQPAALLDIPAAKEYIEQHNMQLHFLTWGEVALHAEAHSGALNRIVDVINYTNDQIAQLDSLTDLANKCLGASVVN